MKLLYNVYPSNFSDGFEALMVCGGAIFMAVHPRLSKQ